MKILLLRRLKSSIDIGNVLVILKKVSKFVKSNPLLRSNVFQIYIRNLLESSGDEFKPVLLDVFLNLSVCGIITIDDDGFIYIAILVIFL